MIGLNFHYIHKAEEMMEDEMGGDTKNRWLRGDYAEEFAALNTISEPFQTGQSCASVTQVDVQPQGTKFPQQQHNLVLLLSLWYGPVWLASSVGGRDTLLHHICPLLPALGSSTSRAS